jgi:hypothetical protein
MTRPLILNSWKEPKDGFACLLNCEGFAVSHFNVSQFRLKSAKVEREPARLKLDLDKLTSDGLCFDPKRGDLELKIVHDLN